MFRYVRVRRASAVCSAPAASPAAVALSVREASRFAMSQHISKDPFKLATTSRPSSMDEFRPDRESKISPIQTHVAKIPLSYIFLSSKKELL